MTAPPYPAKGTTDWYEPLHDYTEGIRDEADDKLALKADTASLGTAAFANTGAFATSAQGAKADSAVQPAALDGLNADRHTHANKAVLDTVTENTVSNAADAVTKAGAQTITGLKTFSGAAPSLGANLTPALSAWTYSGAAVYESGTNTVIVGAGAASMSCSIPVTNGTGYQFDFTMTVTAGHSIGGSIGGVVQPIYAHANGQSRSFVIVASGTGTQTATLTLDNEEGSLSAATVRAATLAPAALIAGIGEVRAYGSNTANGVSALYSNTTGSNNTANGFYALYSNTTGNSNTANGVSALYSNTTGGNNTANGVSALRSNTTGGNNTASGLYALYSNTTGSSNTASGGSALYSNTTGGSNTANGVSALYSNTTGGNNTANGFYALRSNTTGSSNTAMGWALRAVLQHHGQQQHRQWC
jgi:hypothetical protein